MPTRKTAKPSKPAARKAPSKKTSASTPAAETPGQIYQIKVTLKDFKPSIWRRIQVRGDATLGELHAIIQMAMGWSNSHLHQFIIGQRPRFVRIGPLEPDIDDELTDEDEDKVVISEVLPASKTKMVYEYDFGDSWEHEVVLEKIAQAEAGVYYPRCIAGENACPPEDVGGVWGYADFLEAINDPDHEQHEDMLDWVGGEFDPQEFDLDLVNKQLKVRQNYQLYGRGLF